MSAAHKLCTTKRNSNKNYCQVKSTVAQFVICKCYNCHLVYYWALWKKDLQITLFTVLYVYEIYIENDLWTAKISQPI